MPLPPPSTFLPVRSPLDVGVVDVASISSVCGHCFDPLSAGQMKLCGGCWAVAYCSPACQKEHWKYGGHKNACQDSRKVRKGDKAFARAMATLGGTEVARPRHPCPACRVHEADAQTRRGSPGLCTSCGTMHCGDCIEVAAQSGYVALPPFVNSDVIANISLCCILSPLLYKYERHPPAAPSCSHAMFTLSQLRTCTNTTQF